MSFTICELHEIISVINDAISIPSGKSSVSIQIGIKSNDSNNNGTKDNVDKKILFELYYFLNNDKMLAKIWDSRGELSYTRQGVEEPNLKVNFDDKDVIKQSGSFHVAIETFRQFINLSRSSEESSNPVISRSSEESSNPVIKGFPARTIEY